MEKVKLEGYKSDCIKTFRTIEDAEQFRDGDLFMGRQIYYRNIEDRILGVRDPFEGKIKMNMPDGYEAFIDFNSLKRAVYGDDSVLSDYDWVKIETQNAGLSFAGNDDTFVLCSTDIETSLSEAFEDDGTARFEPGYIEFAKQYQYAVLFSSLEIADKLSRYAKTNDLIFMQGLVEYENKSVEFDDYLQKTNEPIDPRDCVFNKDEIFIDQHEYRFALLPTLKQTNRREHINTGEKGIIVSVGEITSAFLIPTDLIDALSFVKQAKELDL